MTIILMGVAFYLAATRRKWAFLALMAPLVLFVTSGLIGSFT